MAQRLYRVWKMASAGSLASTSLQGATVVCAATATESQKYLSKMAYHNIVQYQSHSQCQQIQQLQKQYASVQVRQQTTNLDVQAKIDEINEKFGNAREEIEDARDDAETVYFNESCEAAREATQEVLDMWDALLASMPEDEKKRVQNSMGLKMEQLKAEIEELNNLHD